MPEQTSNQDTNSCFIHLRPPLRGKEYPICTLFTYNASETSGILEGVDLSVLVELGFQDIVEIQILRRNDERNIAVGVMFKDLVGDLCIIEFGPVVNSTISFYTHRDRRIQITEEVNRRIIELFHQVCRKEEFASCARLPND